MATIMVSHGLYIVLHHSIGFIWVSGSYQYHQLEKRYHKWSKRQDLAMASLESIQFLAKDFHPYVLFTE